MKRVIVNMQSHVMSDAIKMALNNNTDFSVTVIDSTDEIAKKCYLLAANLVIMEVTEYPPCMINERLLVRNEIKQRSPNCKIVLLVDENAEEKVIDQVKQAKIDGIIDQLIYGSVSAKYLIALLETT